MGTSIDEIQAQLKKAKSSGKPPPTAAVGIDLTARALSSLPFWGGLHMVVLAAPGAGKTHFLLTGSRHYTTWPPPEPAVFDDIVIAETDPLGLAMAYEANVDIPRIIDMTAATDEEMSAALSRLPDALADAVAQGPTRFAAVDTGTILIGAVSTMEQQKSDSARLWSEIARRLRGFFSACRKIPVPIIVTGHLKPPAMIIDDKQRQYIMKACDAAGLRPDQLPMDIEGRKATRAIQAVSTMTGVIKQDANGARVIRFQDERVDTKQRFRLCVNKEEPAHLGAILTKIAKGCNKPMPEEQ